jgi:hypothetical protein
MVWWHSLEHSTRTVSSGRQLQLSFTPTTLNKQDGFVLCKSQKSFIHSLKVPSKLTNNVNYWGPRTTALQDTSCPEQVGHLLPSSLLPHWLFQSPFLYALSQIGHTSFHFVFTSMGHQLNDLKILLS